MNSILLEAVWKALFVYFYHARLTQVCGVMAHLMLSATLVARLVELLTKFGGVISEAEGMIIEEDFAVQWAFV